MSVNVGVWQMANVLLINPSYSRTYGSAKASITSPVYPTLGLATIGATAQAAGHTVRILDLSYRRYDPAEIAREIRAVGPDVVGVTATSPLMNQMRDISCLVKDISKDIVTVGGGAHPSALPLETMHESRLDYVVYGEADATFVDIVDGKTPRDILGICYRDNGRVEQTAPRPLVEYLDDLPFPAWSLYDAKKYVNRLSRLIVKRPPAAMIEFSRGCVFKCDFCGSKNTMGLGYRKKSPERCADEMEALYKLGYREAILADDIFTSDHDWAVAVCEAIIRRGIDMAWTCTNGIRVDSARDDLFRVMKRAGCYRVHFGFESGNDEVLKAFGKGGRATLQQGHKAVEAARRARMDTFGMFMLGLSADTEETMQQTIDFAKGCGADMMRFGITVPVPGTLMFQRLRTTGHIRSYDWDLYNVYNTRPIFDHPTLAWDTVEKYYKKAYRDAFLKNPRFVLRRFKRGIKTGEFFWDLYYFFKFLTLNMDSDADSEAYAYKDQWPTCDFVTAPVRPVEVQRAQRNTWRLSPVP